jgi:hypothetical protein
MWGRWWCGWGDCPRQRFSPGAATSPCASAWNTT